MYSNAFRNNQRSVRVTPDSNDKKHPRLQNLLDRVDEQEKTVPAQKLLDKMSWPDPSGHGEGCAGVPLT
jgi:hypothetical protein